MSDYEAYEKAVEEIRRKNEAHLMGFEAWLTNKGLSRKTIHNHLSNVEFYINSYLCRYDALDVTHGCRSIGGFLGDWFIRKALWSSRATIKSTAASIKKFYAYLLEEGVVTQEDYNDLIETIKDEMPDWLEEMDQNDSMDLSAFL